MRKQKIIVMSMTFLLMTLPLLAGEWSRIDEHSLRFEGRIEMEDSEQFKKLFDDSIDTIVVTSGGGDVLAAIPVAQMLQTRDITIVVDTICGSSCADYYFISAKHKKVPEGSLVLFHGGLNSTLASRREMIKVMKEAGATSEQINDHMTAWEEGAKKEKEIYEKAGVDLSLLEYSSEVTEDTYHFWAPSPETLRKLGVRNLDVFWYPDSEAEINKLANAILKEYAKKYPVHATFLNIIGGDIPEHANQDE